MVRSWDAHRRGCPKPDSDALAMLHIASAVDLTAYLYSIRGPWFENSGRAAVDHFRLFLVTRFGETIPSLDDLEDWIGRHAQKGARGKLVTTGRRCAEDYAARRSRELRDNAYLPPRGGEPIARFRDGIPAAPCRTPDAPDKRAGSFGFSFGFWRGPPRVGTSKRAFSSGPAGTRTRDLRIKSPQLYRLSYQPKMWNSLTFSSYSSTPLTPLPILWPNGFRFGDAVTTGSPSRAAQSTEAELFSASQRAAIAIAHRAGRTAGRLRPQDSARTAGSECVTNAPRRSPPIGTRSKSSCPSSVRSVSRPRPCVRWTIRVVVSNDYGSARRIRSRGEGR